jgi:hypothetical protein
MTFSVGRAGRGLGLAILATLCMGATDPLTGRIEDADAVRFAAVFAASKGAPSAAQLQEGYLDGAGQGVAVFTTGRIENAGNLAAAIKAEPARYDYAIKTCLPLLNELNADLRTTYLAYRGLLPDRPLPAVHVVFGAGNSGGTASADAQVLGLEVMCGPGTTPDQFKQAMRSMFAHETVHSWQTQPGRAAMQDLLLMAALREGVPDYLAMVVTGRVPGPERNAWAREREAWLWQQFEADRRKLTDPEDPASEAIFRRWFSNYGAAPEGWPFEAGYWVGMRIAESYVERASDKRAAINTLIAMEDPRAILAASGYAPR